MLYCREMQQDVEIRACGLKGERVESAKAQNNSSAVQFTQRVRAIIEAQPLNHLRKLEFVVMPRSNL